MFNTTFAAVLCEAIVDDPKAETGKRDARYILARDIPAEILSQMGHLPDNKRHPHKVLGMAWDLTVNNWRNMKNAQPHTQGEAEVVWDVTDPRTFIA